MRFVVMVGIFIFMALISMGVTAPPPKQSKTTQHDPIRFRQAMGETGRHAFGYDFVREEREPVKKTGLINGVEETLGGAKGNAEVSGVAECESRVCDVAQCECVDSWDLFSQTCNLIENQFCSANVEEVTEGTDDSGTKTYNYFFEAITNHKGEKQTTVHVITTTAPIFDEAFDYGSYAVSGQMRTLSLDGIPHCLDEYLPDENKDDCYYDVRIMGHQPLCPKKRTFFDVANHADVLIQMRYLSDLERGKPSMTKPPFACMRLCNPLIDSSDSRGFIAANPGVPLQKCVPKQIYVDRSDDKSILEAQILLTAANDLKSIGQQWNQYNEAGETMDHLSLGVGNSDLKDSVQALKDEYLTCEKWLPAHEVNEDCSGGNGTCVYEYVEYDLGTYFPQTNGSIVSLIDPGMTAKLEGVTLAGKRSDGVAYITIESGGGTITTTSTTNGDQAYDDFTIFDQTWKDDKEAVNGVATVKMKIEGMPTMCYKLCIGGYSKGNSKCNEEPHRTYDCVKETTDDERMEIAAMKSME